MASLKPASPFAKLLRQSKFASYDPSIAQVYTSHGGDFSRGNWGLKRPLPIKRQNAHITISAVDSKEQQTVWHPADQQARWIQMWDEVGLRPVNAEGPWVTRLGQRTYVMGDPIDSEFVESGKHRPARTQRGNEWSEAVGGSRAETRTFEAERSAATPNIYAMSPQEFQRYLQKIRSLRAEFDEYRKEQSDKQDAHPTLWQHSVSDTSTLWKNFLAKKAFEQNSSPSSRVIEQQPQRYAGLGYSPRSPWQAYLFNKPHAGRVLVRYTPQSRTNEYKASFAGMSATLNANDRGSAEEIVDWISLAKTGDQDPQRGVTDFRLTEARLTNPPIVVGETHMGMRGMRLETHVKAISPDDISHNLAKQPGTKEFVTMDMAKVVPGKNYSVGRKGAAEGIIASAKRATEKRKEPAAKELLGKLLGIVQSGDR